MEADNLEEVRITTALYEAMALLPNKWLKIKAEDVTVLRSLEGQDHEVCWILDRQKPSVYPSYDFDEERLGVTKEGKVIVGFDSGCSCPSPWDDSYPDCYEVMTLEEFKTSKKEFDIEKKGEEWWQEAYINITQIIQSNVKTK